jgi:hypothetical protein
MNQVSVLRLDDLNAVAFIENRVVRFCAAHIIRILERWTKRKMERQQDPWVYMPIIRQEKELAPDSKNPTSWHQEMLGQFGKDAIRSALAILEQVGVLLKRKNPYNRQDRTYQYLLCSEGLKTLKTPPPSESDISPLKGDYSPIPQRSTPGSTFKELERSDRAAGENSEAEQDKSLDTPKVSPLEKELASQPKHVAEDQGSAAAPPSDFEDFKQVDLTRFEMPDDENSLLFEFFRWVIAHRISKLPNPPVDLEVVAVIWIRKYGKTLRLAFLKWKQSFIDRPLPPPPPPLPEEEFQRSPSQILAQYQTSWQRSPQLRAGIQKMIEQRPDWGIEIGKDGPRWKSEKSETG